MDEKRKRPSLVVIIGGGFIALLVVFVIVAKITGFTFKEEPPTVVPRTPPPVTITIEASSPMERRKVEGAVALFKKSCGPLMRYWSDVKAATASITRHESLKLAPTQAQEKGWLEVVEITVDMKLAGVSHQQVVDWGAMNQTCWFQLGAGKRPGIFVSKDSCKRLCAIPVTGGGGSKSLPGAASLGLAGIARTGAGRLPLTAKESNQLARKIFQRITSILKKSDRAGNLRRVQTATMHPRCLALMKRLQAKVEDLKKQADRLPSEEYLKLKRALVNMHYCLQCYKGMMMCKHTKEDVEAAKDEVSLKP